MIDALSKWEACQMQCGKKAAHLQLLLDTSATKYFVCLPKLIMTCQLSFYKIFNCFIFLTLLFHLVKKEYDEGEERRRGEEGIGHLQESNLFHKFLTHFIIPLLTFSLLIKLHHYHCHYPLPFFPSKTNQLTFYYLPFFLLKHISN